MKAISVLLLALGGAVGCASFGPAQDAVSDARNLVARDIAFSEWSASKGTVSAFREFLAEDATVFPKSATPIEGRKEIIKQMEADTPIILRWKPISGKVTGDLGYTFGTYTVADQATKASLGGGRYMSVWRRQVDGTWKVAFDMGAPNPALAK
jgi:ketosteroid isomerase-like protein